MKPLFATLLITIFTLSLAACGDGGNKTPTQPSGYPVGTPVFTTPPSGYPAASDVPPPTAGYPAP
jgi:hypothetical protein